MAGKSVLLVEGRIYSVGGRSTRSVDGKNICAAGRRDIRWVDEENIRSVGRKGARYEADLRAIFVIGSSVTVGSDLCFSGYGNEIEIGVEESEYRWASLGK